MLLHHSITVISNPAMCYLSSGRAVSLQEQTVRRHKSVTRRSDAAARLTPRLASVTFPVSVGCLAGC